MNLVVRRGSPSEAKYHLLARLGRPTQEAIAPGVAATPPHDLTYMGGRTIPHLVFKTLYVAGTAWDPEDVSQIDAALAAAMSDEGLNGVMQQYFNTPISTEALPSQLLAGNAESTMSQGDIESLLRQFQASGGLGIFDASVTAFNVALPPDVVLSDDPSDTQANGDVTASAGRAPVNRVVPESEATDSLDGLAGFHGSVSVGGRDIYYTVAVYSQAKDQQTNGIVAFDQPWKNVVATLYHELNEVRTDPDVAKMIAGGSDSLLGWISSQGEECGDFPIEEADPLQLVFQEVRLASGAGTVPVQFMYSNRVHGPEGPPAPSAGDTSVPSSTPDGPPLPSSPSPEPPSPPAPRVGEVLRDAIEAALGQVGPGRHDQTHSSEAYGVYVHYKSP